MARLPVGERVRNGIEALDRADAIDYICDEGGPWRDAIDKDTLSMDNSCLCIIGQLQGRFHVGRVVLHERFPDIFPEEYEHDRWASLGFIGYYDDGDLPLSARRSEYKALDAAWKAMM